MVAIPTVKSFCGCCDLKVPCIVMATLRMIIYIIGVLAYLYFFVFLDMAFKEKQNRNFTAGQVQDLIRVLFFVLSVNVLVTIVFIIGVRAKSPAKMEYYVIAVGLNVVLFLFLFKIILAVFATIDCYILLCSYSLCKQYQTECQGVDVTNTVYTTVNTVITQENDDPSSQSTAKQNV